VDHRHGTIEAQAASTSVHGRRDVVQRSIANGASDARSCARRRLGAKLPRTIVEVKPTALRLRGIGARSERESAPAKPEIAARARNPAPPCALIALACRRRPGW